MRAVAASDRLDDFHSVSINTLLPSRCSDMDLFIQRSTKERPRLYRSHDIEFDMDDVRRLIAKGVRTLYIRKSDHQEYQDQLRRILPALLGNEELPLSERYSCLAEVVRDTLATSFKQNDISQAVASCTDLAKDCVRLLQREDYTAKELVNVLQHDFCTFTHSANVGLLSVLLSRALGISDEEELRQITVGGLLHDLGKQEVPDYILTKPSKLTEQEFDIVKRHAVWGYRKLCHRNDISRGQLMMVYQHHERVAGGGYPVGCPKGDIHYWARICTVVDVFEALSANRPYRRPLQRSQLFETMSRGENKLFDGEILRCWMSVMA